MLKDGFPVKLQTTIPFLAAWGAVAADIDLDGQQEIIMNSSKKMYVIESDGSFTSGWPVEIPHLLQYSPAVGDLDGDGTLEIVAQAREHTAQGIPGRLYAWHSDGTEVEGFPVSYGGLFGNTPVLYDFDGDGTLEIIVDFDNKFYLLNHKGEVMPGWPVDLLPGVGPCEVASKPAVGDVDGDGVAEIIRSSRCFDSDDTGEESGDLYVFDHFGELLNGWPVHADSGYGFLRADPALADIDNDGDLEIAITSLNWWNDSIGKVHVFDGDGSVLSGWPKSLSVGSAAISWGDVDRDGELDLVVGSYFDAYVWTWDGTLHDGWPIEVDYWNQPSAAIGNIDTTFEFEILTGSNITRNDSGYVWVWGHDGFSVSWSPLRPKAFTLSTPLLVDLENDGSVEIISHTTSTFKGETWIYAWTIPGIPFKPEEFPWPMYGHDRYHTGQHGFTPSDGPVSVEPKTESILQTSIVLEQNYPNPFNPITIIKFDIPVSNHTSLIIYNILGQEVTRLVDNPLEAGRYSYDWDASDVSSGVYIYKLTSGDFVQSRKMILLK